MISINNIFDPSFVNEASKSNFEDLKTLPFIKMLDNYEDIESIEKFKQSLSFDLKSIVVIGIGGSILGLQAITEALYTSKKDGQKKIDIHFLDNVDPVLIDNTYSKINPKSTLFIIQSKSGKTPEILAHYFFLIKLIKDNDLQLEKHLIFVTDPVSGFLKEESKVKKITTFEIPSDVGGRFSVLSPVGFLVSLLVGLNAKEILIGSKNLLFDQQKLQDIYSLSSNLFEKYQNGKNILVIMPYSSFLNEFSNWSVQLISESLGKIDLENKHQGVTPLTSKGVTDQHSKLQLFQEGPDDKSYIFIKIQNHQKLTITNSFEEYSFLNDVEFGDLLNTELQATQTSLHEAKRYSTLIEIDNLNEQSIGELFLTFEILTHFLGLHLKINTFDQPGVERSKILTKELLTKHKTSR